MNNEEVEELKEKLASIEHQRWSDWQSYLHSTCRLGEGGDLVIPQGLVWHWEKQIKTPYSELSEQEKDSDRKEVERYFPLISQSLDQVKKETRAETIKEVVEKIESKRKTVLLEKPNLYQYGDSGSSPFYCSLCQMSEMNITDNKTDDGRYFCRCSYWSDPHNAYIDKSGGRWLGWIDENKAQKIAEDYPCEDNFYNQALDDLKSELTKGQKNEQNICDGLCG